MAIETCIPVAANSRTPRTARPSTTRKPAPCPVVAGSASRSARAELDALAAGLRETFGPASSVESLLLDRIALAAWRLEQATKAEARALIEGERVSGRAGLLAVGRESRRAERSLSRALGLFERIRDARRPGQAWGVAAPAPVAPIVEDEDDVTAVAVSSRPGRPAAPEPTPDPAAPAPASASRPDSDGCDWEHRLTVDPNVSQVSPVVRGTWVTAQQIVALVVDGWTWSDILRAHPELTEADIRACLSFTVEQDEFGGI